MLPLLIVALFAMGLALLYAYRSQSPSVQTVAYSQAVQQINNGQVRKVTITGDRAVLELASGEKQHAIVPQPPTAFETALVDYNAATPTRRVTVEYQPESSGFQVITSILLSLLPVVLLGGFFFYVRSRSRSR
jgi:ATP-dependent Zn protease